MPKIFTPADQDVHELANELIRKHHHHLLHPRVVRVDIIMVLAATSEDGEKQGHALNLHGCRALGIAKIIGPKDRAMGRGDCEIQIDGDEWPAMNEAKQAALLDHELTHFSLKRDSHNVAMIDDNHRPLLKIRKHDYDFGWFTCIAKRHGIASIEVQQARQIVENDGQFYLPGFGIGGDKGPTLSFGEQMDEDTTLPAEATA